MMRCNQVANYHKDLIMKIYTGRIQWHVQEYPVKSVNGQLEIISFQRLKLAFSIKSKFVLNTLHFSHKQNASWRQENDCINGERLSEQEKKVKSQKCKGKKNKSGQTSIWCCSSGFARGIYGPAAAGRDQNYGIGLVGGYGYVGVGVYGQHKKSWI